MRKFKRSLKSGRINYQPLLEKVLFCGAASNRQSEKSANYTLPNSGIDACFEALARPKVNGVKSGVCSRGKW